MNEIIIRSSRPEDNERLQKADRALREDEQRFAPAPLPGVEVWLNEMRQMMQKNGTIFIAEKQGQFAGFISFWMAEDNSQKPEAPRHGIIADLYVLPEFRKQGIAQALIAKTEQYLVGQGVTRLHMSVKADNEAARRIYEKAGFATCELSYEKILPREIGGTKGLEPTRYGDWEHRGRCTDF